MSRKDLYDWDRMRRQAGGGSPFAHPGQVSRSVSYAMPWVGHRTMRTSDPFTGSAGSGSVTGQVGQLASLPAGMDRAPDSVMSGALDFSGLVRMVRSVDSSARAGVRRGQRLGPNRARPSEGARAV